MKDVAKPFVLTAMAGLALAGCMTEKERQAIVAEELVRLERREKVLKEFKRRQAKHLMAEREWQRVVTSYGNENDAELIAYVKDAQQHLAQEALHQAQETLRRARAERIASSLADIRRSYSHGKKYECPFPRKYSSRDWLSEWTEPRHELSEKDKLSGEARLEEFGTKYLPNAYANYEKVRDAARELQQIFNEDFPQHWTINDTSPKWYAFNKVLEKFAEARAEYFMCHDEICHYWLRWRLGVLNAEELAKVDAQKLEVNLLPENFGLTDFGFLELKQMEGKVSDFAAKYAPESYEAYQKLSRDMNTQDALLKEVFAQCREVDHVRYDRALAAAVMMRNDIVRELNALSLSFQTWSIDHKVADKTAEDVAKCDHSMALQVKLFVESLPSYVKDRTCGPIIPRADMVQIPGKNYRMLRTEVTQIQWMAVMGNNPSRFKGADRPVENVSWDDCQEFIRRLNKMDGTNYRLPYSDEWVFACGAGSKGRWGKRRNGEEGPLEVMGWFCNNSNREETHPVGMKEPNAFGLYDMHGNVREWCVWQDSDEAVHTSATHVIRGGSWRSKLASDCWDGYRDYGLKDRDCDLGFRLATFENSQVNGLSIGTLPDSMVAIPGRDYFICKFEVTQSIWEEVMGENPSRFKEADHPVENVSWNNCQAFIKKLNALPKVQDLGLLYRLPTNEEWKYACRAGSTGDYGKLADGTEITADTFGEVAWYYRNSEKKTHPVGQKKPNAFGLYDMHGNVSEWCEGSYKPGHQGGSWCAGLRDAACHKYLTHIVNRHHHDDGFSEVGFRLAGSLNVNR